MDTVISWQSPWLLSMNAPDPEAKDIVRNYLNILASQGFPVEEQGLWFQTGATAIAVHQPYRPVSSASLTKMATTLAALETWPITHRFETLFGHTGTLENGVINGDLVVQWTGDPYFVWEEAIVLGNALNQLGVQKVTGNLVILGEFSMNFEPDSYRSGELFIQAIDSGLWSNDAGYAYSQLSSETPQPSLTIEGEVTVSAPNSVTVSQWLIRHQSLPLVPLLKAMNIYSNNEMAEQFAVAAGGIDTVMAKAAERTGVPIAEIRLINGSGLGVDNRLSPRAVVAILLEIQRQLRTHNLSISDVMPVFGQDEGTLVFRELPNKAALKTGTLNTVSSLAGYFPTRDRGPVWFSIQNWGGDLELLRAQQDALLLALQQHWGQAPPPETFQPKVIMGEWPYQLGDSDRNTAL
ncbi:D-alanyl-D-alanine carboxypeptidase [Oscillatoria sp. CS-180]|uniref:D-alanyl-D-alanine carboxypeptidase n=1 Tax=Oscillatoria sp. CS-180 TaxID=3021720 RepID=UPI00232EEC14|nr:D-alanyl-D-alanine carboxypeptidase [Oscillatoria sp. CS-180]MDB9526653.1 D-alanyl-D-alanine carboxypeptidase [Oscillatoria sp. CS-180]